MEGATRDPHQLRGPRTVTRSGGQSLLQELFLVLLPIKNIASGRGQGGDRDGRGGKLRKSRIEVTGGNRLTRTEDSEILAGIT